MDFRMTMRTIAVGGLLALAGVSAHAQDFEPTATATFRCADDKSIVAMFYPDSVNLTLSDGRKISLPQAMSASGARYADADDKVVFWNKGKTAFISEGSDENVTYKDCVSD